MRIDKFLKLARLVKRRSVAQEMISVGAVRINKRQVKPSSIVKEGDIVEVAYTCRVIAIEALTADDVLLKRRDAVPYRLIEEKRVNPEERPW